MKHLNAEKYNIAWFKLAECVSRKEKERALGVYRLLSHSLENDALVSQLYGDLLLCFEDLNGAVEKYVQAAQAYKDKNQIIESIAVYEHLIVLQPGCQDHILELCDLYKQVDLYFKMIDHVNNIIAYKKLDLAEKLIKKLNSVLKPDEFAVLNQNILFTLLESDVIPEEKVMQYVEKIVDCWSEVNDEHMLSDFLDRLKASHEDFYEYASEYAKK